ncbi:RHS repeat-associated core domain-containing protein [Sorangium cellulosum]|uniref:Uncharacterized protein n=1 Tax=Sorangium cellulosum TaxID=56 RepID=A0A150QPP5_SORCE|nr:RHS repeat-associated core domain-containing protein [Sorangium cellulosum]KYF69666.1 hypothetical protein BE15_25785 [Sorangium cellulosum]
MNPGVFVMGGGAGGGGSGGAGGGGKGGDQSAGGSNGGKGAGGGGKGAPDYEKHPECGYASHPVDVVTGRAFTYPTVDVHLPGPLPLLFRRMYSTTMAARDTGLGFGWGHTIGWEVEVRRRSLVVWNEQGMPVEFPMIRPGDEVVGPFGWALRREAWGFVVDANDDVYRTFCERDEPGLRYRLSAIEDRNKNRITIIYQQGKIASIVDSAGRSLRVHTTPEGRIASIETKNAVAGGAWLTFATYRYDGHGNLVECRDTDGFSSHYEYDEEHLLTKDTDRAGLTFYFVYDRHRRCIESWGEYPGERDPSLAEGLPQVLADGRTRVKGISHCKMEYLDNGYSEVADSARVRRFFGNEHGLLDKRVEGQGVISCTYNAAGHLTSRTDELGGTTLYELDDRGQLTRLTDPKGRSTFIARGAYGLPVEIVDPAGGVTRIERDQRGNPELVVDPTGAITSYRHDERGLIKEIINSHGHSTRFDYDAHGNMTAAFESSGAITRFGYDALGRRTSVTDPLGAVVRFAYSGRGDHVATYDELGGVTRYAYDGEAKMTQVTWPSGRVRSFRWGGYNKLCEIVDEAGGVTRMLYDLDGLPVALVNPKGEKHHYEHDASGRLVAEVTFDGVRRRYRCDLAGRLVAVIGGTGETMEFVRDASGMVVERRYADGTTEALEYDECGDLVRAVGPDVEVQFQRDAAGRILRETQLVRGEALSVARGREGRAHVTMTSLGHAIAMTEGPNAFVRRYLLGEAHEVESRSDVYGREVERVLPGGGRLESVFDAMGRLAERRARGPFTTPAVEPGHPEWVGSREGGLSVRRVHHYSLDGHIGADWDLRHGQTQYEVDALGQLLCAVRERGREDRYAYDATGNIVRVGSTSSVFEQGNRLLEHGTTHYQYDDLGQLIEKSVAGDDGAKRACRYTWNPAGRLSSVTCPDGVVVQYHYDPLGRRLEKRVFEAPAPGARGALRSTTRFLWDGAAVIQEIKRSADELGNPVVDDRRYWVAGDGPVVLAHRDVRWDARGATAGEWVHYVNDPNGAPTHLVDARGAVVGELARSGLGRTLPAPGSEVRTAVRFAGQYEDEETGLHYNHFRYYDPDTGRYLSHDPISLRGGHNLYRYVRDPNTMTDPHGLVPCQCVMITNNGPPERLVGQDPNGNNLYAWRRNSGGSPQNVHPDVSNHIPPADQLPQGSTASPDQRGKCAEPAALTDYRNWLAKQPNPGNATMLNRIQQGVVAVVPMNKGGPTSGSYKAPCDFCGPTLSNMGLSNRVMTPQAAAQAMPNIAQVFTIQNVPVFR